MEKEGKNSLNNEEIEVVTASIFPIDDSEREVTEEEFVDFIGDNADRYITKFGKFYADGKDRFAFTWHWPGFFFTYIWLAYRRLYGWALAVFLLNFFPVLGFLCWFVFGLTGNYLYYKYSKKKILKLKARTDFPDSIQMSIALQKMGGVSFTALGLAIIAAIFITIWGILSGFEALP